MHTFIRGTDTSDQDHFENDRLEYERLGNVTRKQFGIMLGAGIAMMLPKVANAIAVTESDVNVTTPDGTADCYFVHPASGTAPGVLICRDQSFLTEGSYSAAESSKHRYIIITHDL